jgi:lysophospholipase L1-like esterase
MWQSHLSYHPQIGYTYTPRFKGRLPHESGGYLVRTNAAGFRSDREFTPERPPGVFRALMFGDSQTAGLGVGNGQRFSDLMETALPGLEVFNYGLDGVGVDQQHLAWRDFGRVEHDLLIIALYVDDVARVNSRYLKFKDQHGEVVFYAKPYYELTQAGLALNNVPVPKRPWTKATLPPEPAPARPKASAYRTARAALRVMLPHPALRKAVKAFGLTDLAQKLTGIQRAGEYDTPDNPGWLLLREIVAAWVAQSPAPVLLLPIPMWTFVEQSADPASYQARCRELAAQTGCLLHDPLPDLWTYSPEARRAFRFKTDPHLSPNGHQAMARSLTPVLEQLRRERGAAG